MPSGGLVICRIVALGIVPFCVALALVACRRAPTAPDGPPATALSMSKEAAAEAGVSASSGAVKVDIRLYKTKIRKGQSLWMQVVFTNLGNEPLMALVQPFDYLPRLWGARRLNFGLELTDAGGKRVNHLLDDLKEGDVPVWCMTPEEQRPWREFVHSVTSGAEPKDPGATWLRPGESIGSPPYAYQSGHDLYCRRLPKPQPIGQFAEMAGTRTLPVGKYLLRGVYDMAPDPGDKASPGDVRFETPPLMFEVVP